MDVFFENIKNEELINYIAIPEILYSGISSDDYLRIFENSIDIKTASEDFISKLLNNDFKKIDLNKLLKNNFTKFYQKLFEGFECQEDFLIIKNWKINPNINGEVIRICLKRISDVLVEEVKLNKTGKISIYPSLILFLCKLFAISSIKLNNIFEELYNLEQFFPNSKLIEVYFIILYKGEKVYPITDIFKEHLKEYINNNAGKGALSVWYKLVLINKSDKIVFLDENLKSDYIVKSADFVGYPLIRNENILLFTYLYKDREGFFENKFIIESEYYQNSIKAITKEELFKLTFNQIMKIYNNIYEFVDLFKLFIKIKEFDQKKYEINFTILVDELGSYKSKFDSLDNLLLFFIQFYPISKKEEIKSLRVFKNKLLISPLNKFNEKIKEIKNFDEYKEQVDIYKKLKNSIFFIEIYNSSKNKFGNCKKKSI